MQLYELKRLIRTVINEEIGGENKIFNNGEKTQKEAIDYLKNELSGLVPFVSVSSASIGSDTIMLLVAFEPKEKWPHGYVENTNYFRMRIGEDGEMEVFTSSLYKKDSTPSRENRLNVKFRKAKAKTLEDAKNRISKLIEEVKNEYK